METGMMIIAIVSVVLNLLLLSYVFTMRKQVTDMLSGFNDKVINDVVKKVQGMSLNTATARGITESLDKTIMRVGLCEKELDMIMEDRTEQIEADRLYDEAIRAQFDAIQLQIQELINLKDSLEDLYGRVSNLEHSESYDSIHINELAAQVDYLRYLCDELNKRIP